MTLSKFIDYFIHPDRFKDQEELRRTRLLIRGSFLTSIFSNSYLWLSFYFSYDKGVYLMALNVVGFMLLPLLGKTRLNINVLGNLYVALGALAVIVLAYFSGGMYSAIYPWIISIPILALLMVNRSSAGVWGGISLIVMVVMGVMKVNGFEFPIEYNQELKDVWFLTIMPGLLLILLFISFIFEFTQSSALSQLQLQNEQLREQKEIIADQTEELSRLVDEKDYIIRILAHDLRSPLNNIRSLVQLHEVDTDAMRKKETINRIDHTVTNAKVLVDKVLEMDASEQKTMQIKLERVRFNEVLDYISASLNEVAEKKNIKLIIDNKATKAVLNADQSYLSLIFENLVSNSIKFSEPDKQVIIRSYIQGEKLIAEVEDEGPGIDKEEERLLFGKFSKLSNKPTAGESSTGLGLALVKRYTNLLNGEVVYKGPSSKGGAIFLVELPLAQ